MTVTTEQLYAVQVAMQQLAQWHEMQRDQHPLHSGPGHAKAAAEHNKAASDCYTAAIAIGELINKRAEF